MVGFVVLNVVILQLLDEFFVVDLYQHLIFCRLASFIKDNQILILLTENTLIFPTEPPFQGCVFLEKAIIPLGITIHSLIKNELRIVNNPCNYKLVELAIIKPSKPFSSL